MIRGWVVLCCLGWLLVVLPRCVFSGIVLDLGSGSRWTRAEANHTAHIVELQKAGERFRDSEEAECLALLEAASKKYAHLPPARLMFARMFLATNQIPRGRVELERVAVETPDFPGTHLTFGELALHEGRLSDAELHLRKAQSLTAPAAWRTAQATQFAIACLSGLAEVAERRGQWQEARGSLEAAIKLSADDARLHQRMGRVAFAVGNIEDCERHLGKAVSIDDSLPPAATQLGLLYSMQSRFEQAEQLLKEAIRLHPGHAKALLVYASWLSERERCADALPIAQAALAADPKSRDARFLCGMVQHALRRPEKAEPHFAAIVTESPGDLAAVMQFAVVLAEQSGQKRHRALDLALAAVRKDPTNRNALATLGWCQYHVGHFEEAERALQISLLGGTGPAEAAYYLAKLRSAQGRNEQVRPLLEAAMKTTQPFAYREEVRSWMADLSEP